MLRVIFAFIFACPAVAATPREQQLEQLKKQFPSHVAGPVTDTSEAHVQVCYRKYHNLVSALQVDSLAEQITELRREVDFDLTRAEFDLERAALQSEKVGIRQNMSWLREKVTPYINRLMQFQRGR
jgi:hypothetical protein